MLLQIRDYLRCQKIASNQQIAREFAVDILTLQPMLDIWLRKGVIVNCQDASYCKNSCINCRQQSIKFYRFVK